MILLLILATENGEWGNMEAPNRDPPLFKEIGYLLGYVSNNMIVGFVLNQHLKWWQAMGWNGRCRKTIPCFQTNQSCCCSTTGSCNTTTACLHSTTSSTCFKVVNRLVNILKFYKLFLLQRKRLFFLWLLDELLKKPCKIPAIPSAPIPRGVSWLSWLSWRSSPPRGSCRGSSPPEAGPTAPSCAELDAFWHCQRTGKLYTTSLLVSIIFNGFNHV